MVDLIPEKEYAINNMTDDEIAELRNIMSEMIVEDEEEPIEVEQENDDVEEPAVGKLSVFSWQKLSFPVEPIQLDEILRNASLNDDNIQALQPKKKSLRLLNLTENVFFQKFLDGNTGG